MAGIKESTRARSIMEDDDAEKWVGEETSCFREKRSRRVARSLWVGIVLDVLEMSVLKSPTRVRLGSLSGGKVLSKSMRQDRSFWEEGGW